MMNKENFVALVPETNEPEFTDSKSPRGVLSTPYKTLGRQERHRIFDDLGFSDKIQAIHDEAGNEFKSTRKDSGIVSIRSVESQLHNVRSRTMSTIEQTSRCFLAQDDIIQQKDIMISSLQNIIDKERERSLNLEQKLIQNNHAYLDSRNNYLEQEYESQLERMKYQMQESNSKNHGELEKLQRKLGEKEYEVVKLTIALKENNLNKDNIIDKLKSELETACQSLLSEENQTDCLKSEMNFLRQENTKLESYLSSLPTCEEFAEMKKEIKALREERDQLLTHKENVCSSYKDTKRELMFKQSQLDKAGRKINELQNEVSQLNRHLEKYERLGPISMSDFEKQRNDMTTLQAENTELKQNLAKSQKKLTLFHYELVARKKDSQNEKQKLQHDMGSFQDKLQEKSAFITQIQARNQELLKEKLMVEGKLKKLEDKYTDDMEQTLCSVFSGTLSCFDEVKNFVTLCQKMSLGEEPDIQLLLGLRDSPREEQKKAKSDLNIKELKERLEKISQIKNDLDGLRSMIAERHAEEIGKNMCFTQ